MSGSGVQGEPTPAPGPRSTLQYRYSLPQAIWQDHGGRDEVKVDGSRRAGMEGGDVGREG